MTVALRCISRWPSRNQMALASTTRYSTIAVGLFSTRFQQKCCPLATSAQRRRRPYRSAPSRPPASDSHGWRLAYRLAFCVGNEPVSNFRMIERCVVRATRAKGARHCAAPSDSACARAHARRHYFRDRLLKSFDFTFPFWSVPSLRNREDAHCAYCARLFCFAVSRTARTPGRRSTRYQR